MNNIYIAAVLLCQCVFSLAQETVLWYDHQATEWTEALPVGNSKLGAMVFGRTDCEELQLNEETYWSGGPHNNNKPEALSVLEDVRNLISEGKTVEAHDIINANFFSGQHGMKYLTLGSLKLDFGHNNVTDYRRELDLSTALASTSYSSEGSPIRCRTFASLANDVIVMQIKAEKKGALNFTISHVSPLPTIVSASKNMLTVVSAPVDHEGVKGQLAAQCSIEVRGDGKRSVEGNKIVIKNAQEVTLVIAAATNFVNYNDVSGNAAKCVSAALASAKGKSFDQLFEAHKAAYQEQFNRVSLNLAGTENAKLPTDERLLNYGKGGDPSLPALLFNYGRYLLISSSQPGGQAANLQGIWNGSADAPWDSKYTININAEMNYWPAEVTNLSDLHSPFFSLIDDLSNTGKSTAKTMYNADGWVAHHNTDIWRVTGPIDGAYWGMWPNGGGWLVQHLWQHYLFTGDVDFLRKHYDAIKGAADFYMSVLRPEKSHGWLVLSPSVSPEHGPSGSPTSVTEGCTMDNQITFDALSAALQATEILGGDKEYEARLKATIAKLPPMQIGKYGQLQEWLGDYDDPKDDHRHISHLYGLYPSNQISPYRNPMLFNAAKNTLIQRGDFATGWSIGWKINMWARMLDGNHAFKIINNFITLLSRERNSTGFCYANLFCAHPPFQIDGNFGFTAGVAEMLVQSHDGALHFLPALPDAWQEGSVSGLVARGGYVVDIAWKNNMMTEAKVTARRDGTLRLRSYKPLTGEGLRDAKGESQNAFMQSADVATPIVSEGDAAWPKLLRVYEYDVDLKAGQSVIVK